MLARRRADDTGETLLEVLVAITILAVCVIAFGTSIAVGIRASVQHGSQAAAQTYLRNWAEKINTYVAGGGYTACAPAGTYSTGTANPSLPAGWTWSQTKAQTYSGGSWGTCSTDNGAQQLTLSVTSADSKATESLTIVIRKP